MNRYIRQQSYSGIGEAGQAKLAGARVAVIGLGALGSVSANLLARAGIGYLRLCDRDFVELSNLQRQVLYTEEDARQERPKAEAAALHLRRVNSEIQVDPVVADVNAGNIDSIVGDVDLIIDGSDNYEIRLLLNEACQALKKNWIYGAVLGAEGLTLNILPGAGPCFACIAGMTPAPGSYPTCSTAGILATASSTVASIQCTEALKLLTGSPHVRRELLLLDLWKNTFESVAVAARPDCPACAHRQYKYYGHPPATYLESLCGSDSVQVLPHGDKRLDFEDFRIRLQGLGQVKVGGLMLSFRSDGVDFRLFRDGRAIIKGVKSLEQAKSIYAEYIGL